MVNEKEAIKKLEKYNQTHIIKILDKIEAEEKKELIDQIMRIDFNQIKDLYENIKVNKNKITGKIKPIESIDKSKLKKAEIERLENLGIRKMENIYLKY